jgi:hypothetical protein
MPFRSINAFEGALSLPNIRYLFWPLQLRARDCYRFRTG